VSLGGAGVIRNLVPESDRCSPFSDRFRSDKGDVVEDTIAGAAHGVAQITLRNGRLVTANAMFVSFLAPGKTGADGDKL
jgi:hypothetical protein